jgi:hypothetical protein
LKAAGYKAMSFLTVEGEIPNKREKALSSA